ncbi:MAG: tripartite tricarboxylate transporter substrate-binding protein, partial [Gemmatimonas sp.]
ARAQGRKPLRLVIPGPPGGASDIIARILEGELTRLLGQTLVIEPRPGAGGNVATEMVAKAPPDGQTILFGDIGPLAINVSLYPSLRYDPVRDFEPIAKVAVFPWIVAAHPSLGVRSLADLFELARRTPEGLPFATPGQGTPMHLTGAMLSKVSGATFRHVPYKGGGPATIGEIAEAAEALRKFLEAILLDLRRRHLLVSKRGRTGGYALATRLSADISTAPQAQTDAAPYSENLLGYLLGRAHYQFMAGFRPTLEARGLSETDLFILSLLAVRSPLTATEIASHMAYTGVDVGPATLGRLCSRGLLSATAAGFELAPQGRDDILHVMAAAKARE